MKLYRQDGKENWFPVVTSDAAVESVAGDVQVAPPSVEAAPAMEYVSPVPARLNQLAYTVPFLAATHGKNWSPGPPPMVTGLAQVAPPSVERMYTTSALVPFQLDHTTCSVEPSSASAGKLSSRKVAPGSGLGMSLIGAMSLVVNVAPPSVETAKATASMLPLNVSKVTYTVPDGPTTTVDP